MTYKSMKSQALEDLKNYHYLKRQQESIPKQIELLQNSGLYRSNCVGNSVMVSADSDRKLIQHISRIENLENLLTHINFKITAMENTFGCLSEEEKKLLFSYYINRQRKSVTSLSLETNTERSWLYRKADRVLRKYILSYFGTLGEDD